MKRPRILVNVFHPDLAASRGNRLLLEKISDLPDLSVNDIYAHYPDGRIDVSREQQLLLEHDLIVFQHPFYWFSGPAMLKEWLDKVLVFGFAYPPGKGDRLIGKHWLTVITSGSPDWAYTSGGYHNFTVPELLRPFQQTAYYAGMRWVTPFHVHSVARPDYPFVASDDEILLRASELRAKLEAYDLEESHSRGPVMPQQLAKKNREEAE